MAYEVMAYMVMAYMLMAHTWDGRIGPFEQRVWEPYEPVVGGPCVEWGGRSTWSGPLGDCSGVTGRSGAAVG